MKSHSSSILFFGGESILHVQRTTVQSFLVCTNILVAASQGIDDDDVCDTGTSSWASVSNVIMLWLVALEP